MSAGRWSNQEQYEALHGTQEEQARKQSSIGVTVGTDGPWRLVRKEFFKVEQVPSGDASFEFEGFLDQRDHDNFPLYSKSHVLPNSVRSTRNEIERLQEEERTRTGFLWQIEKFTRD